MKHKSSTAQTLSEDFKVDKLVDEAAESDRQALPVVETKGALAVLDHAVVSSADEEAVEFLLTSAVNKMWKHAFRDEEAAVAEAERVRKRFLDEYRQAKELRIPQGYAFEVEGELTPPDLMQRLVATRIQTKKRVGNWSGTGTGKTLSAVLATRLVGSSLTVICCPNSIVGDLHTGWRSEIKKTFRIA